MLLLADPRHTVSTITVLSIPACWHSQARHWAHQAAESGLEGRGNAAYGVHAAFGVTLKYAKR